MEWSVVRIPNSLVYTPSLLYSGGVSGLHKPREKCNCVSVKFAVCQLCTPISSSSSRSPSIRQVRQLVRISHHFHPLISGETVSPISYAATPALYSTSITIVYQYERLLPTPRELYQDVLKELQMIPGFCGQIRTKHSPLARER